MSQDPPPPSRTPLRGAVLGTLRVLAVVLYPLALIASLDGAGGPLGYRFLGTALPLVIMLLPMALLPRLPLAALGLALAGTAVLNYLVDPYTAAYLWQVRNLQVIGLDLLVGVLAAARRPRVSLPAAVSVLAVQALLTGSSRYDIDDLAAEATILTLGMAAAWLGGHQLGAYRRQRAAQRASATAQAVTDERLRIARELHDMVAHSIGVIAIQAGMGRRVIDTRPEAARDALAAIEDTSRETLAGLRRMLGALRRADDDGPAREPAPGLADLDRLVAHASAAGVEVRVRRVGGERHLPPEIDLSAYRIVQEAVTNVVRHAAARACQVVVEQRDGELLIEVVDDGRGGPVGSGYGIAGMRERVGLLHGRFDAGPRPEGGFRVAARLPLVAAS